MRSYVVKRASLEGEIALPPSKSQTLRAILLAALGSGESRIHQFLDSPDTHAMIQACRLFGAEISIMNDLLVIRGVSGKFSHFEDVVHAGNSGILLRFITAIGALCSHPIVVTGDDSIRHNRPMKALLEGLSCLASRCRQCGEMD